MPKNFNLSSKIINNKINDPAFKKSFIHKPSGFLNDLDLFTKGQPFDLYKELRENAPVFFHPPMLSDPEPGYWVLTKYEDIKKVSMNPQIFSSQYSTGTLLTLGSEENRHPKLFKSTIDHMLNLDGEMHLNLRKEHMPFFKPNFISELQSKVSIKVTQLLDEAEKLNEFNLVKELSQQLPYIYTL
jgi:cytochrome P450